MNIYIEIHYENRGNKVLRRGDFKVNSKKYQEDPLQEAINVANKWIYELEYEMPDMIIEKVVINKEYDITNLLTKRGWL